MKERWEGALEIDAFLPTATKNQDLWRALYERARVPAELLERARALHGPWHLLVLSEDWCGDAVNTVPVLARLADEVACIEVRILGRDANPDLMDSHLTGTSRSIPVVMALDEEFREHGWWGPRPAELQRWFMEIGRAMEKDARYLEIRRWYARDRGVTTLAEVIALLETAE